jgi:hypothetical protein
LRLSPAIDGEWGSTDGGLTWSFFPFEDWVWGTDYQIKVNSSLVDLHRNEAAREWSWRVAYGDDLTPPRLVAARALNAEGEEMASLAEGNLTRGWDPDWRLELEFDEEVRLSSLSSRLSLEPSLGLRSDCPELERVTKISFSLTEKPLWGQEYRLCLRSGVEDAHGNTTTAEMFWRFACDLPGRRPPRLVSLCFPSGPAGEEGTWQSFAYPEDALCALSIDPELFPFDEEKAALIELWFACAPGASLDPLELMGKLSFEASASCLEFTPYALRLGQAKSSPPPLGAEYSGSVLVCAGLEGWLRNSSAAGVVTLSAAAGLCDDRGNPTAAEMRFPLLK